MKRPAFLFLLSALALTQPAAAQSAKAAQAAKTTQATPYSAYLFAYFTGNDNKKQEEAIRFALSPDGYHYTALNGDRPVVSSASISETGGVRDPHILRGADGKTFYMVATDMEPGHGVAQVYRLG
jgi:arabinoxylan arabinofuranohydrolase